MKKIAIGCGALLVLFITMAVVLAIPMFRATKGVIQAEMERAAWVRDWTPPEAGLDASVLSPEAVAGFGLVSTDVDAEISEFGIDLAGIHAEYQSTLGSVHVYVYQASFSEKETIFERVGDAPRGGGSSTLTKMPYRCYLKRSEMGQDHLYWANGWLFVFRSVDEEDREPFVKAYFEGRNAGPGEGA